MTWVRIDDLYADHQKVTEVGPLGSAMQIAALCYSNRHLTDGYIAHAVARKLLDFEGIAIEVPTGPDPHDPQVVALRVDWTWVVERLVAAGMWVEVDGGWVIHDYFDYQKSREQIVASRADPEEVSAQRREAGRRGGLAKAANRSKILANDSVLLGDDPGKTASKPLANVANAKQSPSKTVAPVPDPDPVPLPDPGVIDISARSRTPPAHEGASASARGDGAGKMTPARWSETWREFRLGYGKIPPRRLEARWPEFCPDEATWDAIQEGLAHWLKCRQWVENNPNGDYCDAAEAWLSEKRYLIHPPPWNPDTGVTNHEEHQGRAGGDATPRAKAYALGDNDDPYWAENHGLLSEVRQRKRDLAAGRAVPDDGRTGVGGTVSALPGRRVAQA